MLKKITNEIYKDIGKSNNEYGYRKQVKLFGVILLDISHIVTKENCNEDNGIKIGFTKANE